MSTTAEPIDALASLTANDLQEELDRLTLRARLVKDVLSVRRRIEREQQEYADWLASDNPNRQPATAT